MIVSHAMSSDTKGNIQNSTKQNNSLHDTRIRIGVTNWVKFKAKSVKLSDTSTE